jgi:hypothetical protein
VESEKNMYIKERAAGLLTILFGYGLAFVGWEKIQALETTTGSFLRAVSTDYQLTYLFFWAVFILGAFLLFSGFAGFLFPGLYGEDDARTSSHQQQIPQQQSSQSGSPSMMDQLCSACETRNDRAADYCQNCGQKLTARTIKAPQEK